MLTDVTVDSGATAPVHSVRPYQSRIGAPPTLEDVFRSLLPVGNCTSTSPVQLGRTNTYMILNADGTSLISIPPPPSAADQLAIAKSNLEIIENVRNLLSLSITQIAELFGVTRKTVYDWYDGATPRAAVISRIRAVNSVISDFCGQVDLSRLKNVWKVDSGEGSFIDILNNDKLEEPFLKVALVDKINELSSRMVSKGAPLVRATMALTEANVAEFDRHAYPS